MSEPLTRQRSEWASGTFDPFVAEAMERLGVPVQFYFRNVSDGQLRAFVADEPPGLHLSISYIDHKGRPTRYPSWDEIVHARETLLPSDVGFTMHLPPVDQYVSVHASTFHLWEYPERAAGGTAR